jgi:two-component system, NarL family, response regulator LiaR
MQQTSTQKIKILLADDHHVVRGGTRMIIDNEPDMSVVADVANGEELLRVARQLHFDIALVDVNMPGANGLQIARQLRELYPQARILILTGYNNPAYIQASQELELDGFLLKDCSPLQLITSIRMLMMGHQVFPKVGRESGLQPNLTRPSRRELEIIKLAAGGCGNKEIAQKLCITERTVEYHLSNLYSKLAVGGRAEAVKKLYELGWLADI